MHLLFDDVPGEELAYVDPDDLTCLGVRPSASLSPLSALTLDGKQTWGWIWNNRTETLVLLPSRLSHRQTAYRLCCSSSSEERYVH